MTTTSWTRVGDDSLRPPLTLPACAPLKEVHSLLEDMQPDELAHLEKKLGGVSPAPPPGTGLGYGGQVRSWVEYETSKLTPTGARRGDAAHAAKARDGAEPAHRHCQAAVHPVVRRAGEQIEQE